MRRLEINAKALVLVLIALSGTPAVAADVSSESDKISQSREWKRLLHYRRDFLGRERSEIDSPSFFLSPEGDRDPKKELDATIASFAKDPAFEIGIYGQHPQCVFPERFRFLKSKMKIEAPVVSCADFETWKTAIGARGLTLIYAAPYLGNPASMFGHTFLRLNANGSDLLDGGLSFDAQPTDALGPIFIWRGMTGGYPGTFSMQPYYKKIQTYSQIENRDLWEFKLNLSPEQVERVVGHLWELGNAAIDYYFFDENCSYHILSLLEVANTEWNLRERFQFMTVPADTVRALSEIPGAILDISRRPSQASRLKEKISQLSDSERNHFQELRVNPEKIDGSESVAILDALLEVRFKDAMTEERLFLARAAKSRVDPAKSLEPKITASISGKSPIDGHASSKLGASVINENGRAGISFQFRPVLHDFLERDVGYVSSSTLVLSEIEISYFPKESALTFDRLRFVEVENRNSFSESESPLSWRVAFGLERLHDIQSENGFSNGIAGHFHYGLGLSRSFSNSALLASAFLNVHADVSNTLRDRYADIYRTGASLLGSVIWKPSERLKFVSNIESFWFVSGWNRGGRQFWQSDVESAYALGARSEIRLQGLVRIQGKSETEAKVMISRYF